MVVKNLRAKQMTLSNVANEAFHQIDNLNSKVHVHVPMRVDHDSLSMTLPSTVNFI